MSHCQKQGQLEPPRPRGGPEAGLGVLDSDGIPLGQDQPSRQPVCHHPPGPSKPSSSQRWAGDLPVPTPHVALSTGCPALARASQPFPPLRAVTASPRCDSIMAPGSNFHLYPNFKIALPTFRRTYFQHTGSSTIWPPVCQLSLDSSRIYFYSSPQDPNEQVLWQQNSGQLDRNLPTGPGRTRRGSGALTTAPLGWAQGAPPGLQMGLREASVYLAASGSYLIWVFIPLMPQTWGLGPELLLLHLPPPCPSLPWCPTLACTSPTACLCLPGCTGLWLCWEPLLPRLS